jgi:hypothetical protein
MLLKNSMFKSTIIENIKTVWNRQKSRISIKRCQILTGHCGTLHIKFAKERQAKLVFGRGYAGKRNIIQYIALKEGIDYLMFFDDDELPLAVTKTRGMAYGAGSRVSVPT